MATLSYDGLSELREALRNLPSDLAAEASVIVDGTAAAAADEIRTAYPQRLGALVRGVKVTHIDAGKYAAGAIVKSSAKHAFIYENGTQARHTETGLNRGVMPPGHVFVPIVVRRRRAMYARLKDMLTRFGFVVTGDA